MAAAAAAAAERSEAHIKELSDDKAALVQQLTQHLQAVRAQAETNAGLTRELETQQVLRSIGFDLEVVSSWKGTSI